MNKVAIVILTDTSEADGLGRVLNALMAAKEFLDGKDDVRVIFSGAGTKWLVELANPTHKLHGVYQSVKEQIAGACGFLRRGVWRHRYRQEMRHSHSRGLWHQYELP